MRYFLSVLLVLVCAGCNDDEGAPVTSQDLQAVTNVIRQVTSDAIIDVRVVRDSVIVDTGEMPRGAVRHYYHVERKKSGWTITDHGS